MKAWAKLSAHWSQTEVGVLLRAMRTVEEVVLQSGFLRADPHGLQGGATKQCLFQHRTFMEFLAARRLVELEADRGTLGRLLSLDTDKQRMMVLFLGTLMWREGTWEELVGLLAGSVFPGSNRLIFTGFSPCWGGFYISSMGGAGLVFDNQTTT